MNRVVIITGAGSGIGRAVAIGFLKQGDKVALCGRTLSKLEETVSLSGVGMDKSLCITTDVTDPEQVAELFNATVTKFGRLDILFNNAGTNAPPLPLEDLTFAQWISVVNTNLTGPFLCTQQAFRIMKAQSPRGGRIINNGSISSDVPRPNSAPYTTTKHAISGLTKTASLDGRKYDIAVGQINIGNALTDMAQAMTKGVMQANGSTAIEPVMDVSNVVKTVLYMADLPLDANALFVTVMATKMPFVGRG